LSFIVGKVFVKAPLLVMSHSLYLCCSPKHFSSLCHCTFGIFMVGCRLLSPAASFASCSESSFPRLLPWAFTHEMCTIHPSSNVRITFLMDSTKLWWFFGLANVSRVILRSVLMAVVCWLPCMHTLQFCQCFHYCKLLRLIIGALRQLIPLLVS